MTQLKMGPHATHIIFRHKGLDPRGFQLCPENFRLNLAIVYFQYKEGTK